MGAGASQLGRTLACRFRCVGGFQTGSLSATSTSARLYGLWISFQVVSEVVWGLKFSRWSTAVHHRFAAAATAAATAASANAITAAAAVAAADGDAAASYRSAAVAHAAACRPSLVFMVNIFLYFHVRGGFSAIFLYFHVRGDFATSLYSLCPGIPVTFRLLSGGAGGPV